MTGSLHVGAVAYDPKVVNIWEGMQRYLRYEAGLPVQVQLFLSYPHQVEALLEGRIDIAWNTNLAYVQSERWSGGSTAPIAMRDSDRGWRSVFLALTGSPVHDLKDSKGRHVALGSRDSGHAAILPLYYLKEAGLEGPADFTALRHNSDLGKHGDTGESEKEVLKAILDGRAEVGTVGSPFWNGIVAKGLVPTGAVEAIWSSPEFTHCMFTARPGLPEKAGREFREALQGMRWENPGHRAVLGAEGLRAWVEPLDGYADLRCAAGQQGLLDEPWRA